MEAKELMIGDWVLANDKPTKILGVYTRDEVKRYQIGGPDQYWVIVEYNSKHGDNNLKPIPLTVEILEKNEWDIDTHCYANLDLKDSFSSLEFYFHESRLRKYWEGVDEWDNHNQVREITFQCHCNYVHELQHALRLCGLEDLADNFKIN